jgi:3-hydroxyisobutyrate dehydrogenase-like beta-hydroxyacid dehydrogenase
VDDPKNCLVDADGGIISNAAAGALLIDSSTIAPQCSQEVAVAAAAAQMTMVDAPVSVRRPTTASELGLCNRGDGSAASGPPDRQLS